MYIYGADPSSVTWFKSYWSERKRFIQCSSLSDDLAEMERWARGNKTYINTQKTKALLVTVKCIRRRIDKDTGMLEVVKDIPQKLNKWQGINFLACPSMKTQLMKYMLMNSATSFSSDSAFYARHIGPYLKKNQRIIFFIAVFKPLMMYTSSVWTSCNKMLLERVLRIQNGPRALFYMPLALVEQFYYLLAGSLFSFSRRRSMGFVKRSRPTGVVCVAETNFNKKQVILVITA